MNGIVYVWCSREEQVGKREVERGYDECIKEGIHSVGRDLDPDIGDSV
jgi:hypothetical protein